MITPFLQLEEARASTSQISSTSNSAARIQDPPPNHRSDQRSREPLYMDNDYQGHDVEEMRDRELAEFVLGFTTDPVT